MRTRPLGHKKVLKINLKNNRVSKELTKLLNLFLTKVSVKSSLMNGWLNSMAILVLPAMSDKICKNLTRTEKKPI